MKFPALWTRKRRCWAKYTAWTALTCLLQLEVIVVPLLILGFSPYAEVLGMPIWICLSGGYGLWLSARIFEPWRRVFRKKLAWEMTEADCPLDEAVQVRAYAAADEYEERLREIYGECPLVFSHRDISGRVIIWSRYKEEVEAERRAREAHKERGFE